MTLPKHNITLSALPEGLKSWPHVLYPDRKERRWIQRLTEADPLMWWIQKYRRILENARHDDVWYALHHISEDLAFRSFSAAELLAEARNTPLQLDPGREIGGGVHLARISLAAGLRRVAKDWVAGADSPAADAGAWAMCTAYIPFMLWANRVYSFDPKAWELVTKKPVDLSYADALSLFDGFPNRTVLIELPKAAAEGFGGIRWVVGTVSEVAGKVTLVLGAFQHPEEAFERVDTRIHWVLKQQDENVGGWDGDLQEQVVKAFLSSVAYLSSRPEDQYPDKHKNAKGKKAMKELGLKAPARTLVGIQLGNAIRLLEHEHEEASEQARTATGRRSPVPHWRDPHHRVYWTGKGRTVPVVKWVDAVIVNSQAGEPIGVRNKVTP